MRWFRSALAGLMLLVAAMAPALAYDPSLLSVVTSLAQQKSIDVNSGAQMGRVFRADIDTIYNWSGSACAAADDAIQIAPNAGTGCWIAPPQPLYSMQQGTNGQLIVGQTGASPLYKTMSGDATLAASGAITVTGSGGHTFTANCVAFLETPSSANLRACLSDETGTGFAYFQGGDFGTPSAGVLTNATGLPSAGLLLTNGSLLIGNGSGVGSALALAAGGSSFFGTPSSANLRGFLTDESGTGAALFQNGDLGTPTAGVATNLTGLPITSGLTSIPQGAVSGHRLTLTSGTPVLTATVSGATTIYSTPYNGSLIAFYDGTNWHWRVCAEMSNITTNSATGNAGPAAVAANSVYDLYAWENSGVCTLTRSPAWTSSTNRGTGAGTAEQERVNGVWMNKQSITNGPAADRGTYLGTVASNGSSQIDFILGGSASGGTACFLYVWNNYNRIGTRCRVIDSGTSYTYASATIREARASTTNAGSFVFGQQEDQITALYTQRVQTAATASSNQSVGTGFDSTTTFGCNPSYNYTGTANLFLSAPVNTCIYSPTIGTHTISANEQTDGSTTATFDANSLAVLQFEVKN